jgi:hypothetical protein
VPVKEVVVHPLVLLSVVDHYNRVAKDSRRRVVGVLLGETFKGRVDVTNSFAGGGGLPAACPPRRRAPGDGPSAHHAPTVMPAETAAWFAVPAMGLACGWCLLVAARPCGRCCNGGLACAATGCLFDSAV